MISSLGYLADFLARESLMQIAIGGQIILLNYTMGQRGRLLSNKSLEAEQEAWAALGEFFERADNALYKAKARGRNQTAIAKS